MEINDLIMRYSEIYVLITNYLTKLIDPQYSALLDDNISDLVLDRIKNTNIIKLKDKPKQLWLYHGTSYENYLKIKKDGYIFPTQYKDVDVGKSQMSKLVSAYYHTIDNYVFLDSGLDIPIDYACGQYRQNVIDLDGDNIDKSDYKRLRSRLNGQGVILAVNPANYNLYLKVDSNEFLVKSKIDINDTKPYFVKRENGIITIYDEGGNKTNDLRYE